MKLLCRFYEPTTGTILVDGADLARMPRRRVARPARRRLPGLLPLRVPARAHRRRRRRRRGSTTAPAVGTAVDRAGADDVVDRLAAGLDTQLGADLARRRRGVVRPVAEARARPRLHARRPLLLVLDEPTAALDAETEHALFERYAAARPQRRRGVDPGRITSSCRTGSRTVRMADLIVVLDGARVVEVGTHEDLMAQGGQYAELYGIQAAAYR